MTVAPNSTTSNSTTSNSTTSNSTTSNSTTSNPTTANLATLDTATPLELAQALMDKLAIAPNDWHRLSANRQVRAKEQAAAALVYLLKDQPEEALARFNQTTGWLDRSLKAPPCPTHGEKRQGQASGQG